VLRFIRRYSESVVIKVLFGLIAASFILFGAGMYGASQMDAVAQVYDHRISGTELSRETELLNRRLQELTRGGAIPGFDLRTQALNALVESALIRHEADRLGLDVTEQELVATITSMPELQRDGRFDRELLERVLDVQRDRGEFEAEVRQSILARRFRSLVTDGVQTSPAEVEAEYRGQNDQVSLQYVRLTATDAGKDAVLSPEDLEKYRTEHQDRYVGPPTTRARYAAFRPTDYQELAAPSPAQIDEFYQAYRMDRFTKPEEVQARHILVRVAPDAKEDERAAARKKVEDLRARVTGGEDFAEVAKASSDDPGSAARGGDLGSFPRGRMTPTFEQAAFALAPGTVSEIVETPFGFHVIKVETHDPGGVQELAAVRDQIVTELSRQRGLDLARSEADQVRRAVVGGKTLADAAGPKHPLTETEPFSETGIVSGIGRAPAFTKAAFALDDGQVSDLIEENDVVYILQPFDRQGPALPPLDAIRARVEADARRDLGAAKAKEQAEALLAKARQIGLDAAAKEANVPVQTTELFARRAGSVPSLGAAPELLDAAFALTPDAPLAPAVYLVSGDAVVAALAEHKAADMAGFSTEKTALEESLLERKRGIAYERFLDDLKKRAVDAGALSVRADALGQG